MHSQSVNPFVLAASVWRHRGLLLALVRREIQARYRGSFLGLAGSFVQPLLMLAVYAFVFTVIFTPRWIGENNDAPFVLLLFAGMLVHGVASDALILSPYLVTGNQPYVKKTVFPLELISLAALGSWLFHALVGFAILGALVPVWTHSLPVTALLAPLVLLPLGLLALGVSWLLASVGVYVRDVTNFTAFFANLLFFASPIIYPVEAVPEAWRVLVLAGPITPAIVQVRRMLVLGLAPEWDVLGLYTLACAGFCWLGFACFQKLRTGFADVL